MPLLQTRDLRGGSQPHAERSRQRSRPQSVLLSSSVDERFDSFLQIAPEIEGSDSLRPIELVRGKHKRSDRMLPYVDVHGQWRLNGIADEHRARAGCEAGDGSHVLYRSDFVVYCHRSDAEDVIGQFSGEVIKIDSTFVINSELLADDPISFFRCTCRRQCALVLDGTDKNPSAITRSAVCQPKDCQVVCLGRP